MKLSLKPQVAPLSPISPLYYGVNLGHRCEGDSSWISFFQYLGVRKGRSFGIGGSTKSISFSTKSSYGISLSGMKVSSSVIFNSAVAELRTFDGHNPRNSGWVKPVNWQLIELSLNTSSGVEGDPNSSVQRLSKIGVSVLAVMQLPCSVFSLSTMDPTTSAYWQERWEYYKLRYAVSRWAWVRGISDIEVWNEPDASSNTCVTSSTWIDMYTLSSLAIQNAYRDFNRDYSNNLLNCLLPPCPAAPRIFASAFASRTFSGSGFYGNITVLNEHTIFPPYATVRNLSWYNLQGYSYHNYGKSGAQLAADTYSLLQQVQSSHDSVHAAPLPIQVTEHAAHTSASWASLTTTSDDILEASRLASQILYTAAYGYENYIFKFSMTVSQLGGQIKSGLHFGDVSTYPYKIGDSTRSGAATRILLKHLQNSKPLLSCEVVLSTLSSLYRNCVTVADEKLSLYHILLVNDASSSGSAAVQDRPYNYTLNTSFCALGVLAGSVVVVTEVSDFNGYVRHGEVSRVTVLTEPTAPFIHNVPSGSVMTLTISASPQQWVQLSPSEDTYVTAGIYLTSSSGSSATALRVGTSLTADHSTTHVTFLTFRGIRAHSSFTVALLQLHVSDVDPTGPFTALVLGVSSPLNLQSSLWTSGSLTWRAVSSRDGVLLVPVYSVYNNVSADFVRFNGSVIVGHVTVNPSDAGSVKTIDVADYISRINSSDCAVFYIVRRSRFNAMTMSPSTALPADSLNGGNSVSFHSNECANTTWRPVLKFASGTGRAVSDPTSTPVTCPTTPPNYVTVSSPSPTRSPASTSQSASSAPSTSSSFATLLRILAVMSLNVVVLHRF